MSRKHSIAKCKILVETLLTNLNHRPSTPLRVTYVPVLLSAKAGLTAVRYSREAILPLCELVKHGNSRHGERSRTMHGMATLVLLLKQRKQIKGTRAQL